MADDLVSVIARAITDAENGGEYSNHLIARAAIDALKAEGWMLCRWERDEKMDDLTQHLADQAGPALGIVSGKAYNLVGIEPPAAALVGRE